MSTDCREHILKSLDASTLGLLPAVRSLAPVSAAASASASTSAAATPRAGSSSALATSSHQLHLAFDQAASDAHASAGAAVAASAQQTPRPLPPASPRATGTPAAGAASGDEAATGSEGPGRVSVLEDRVRALESELAGVRVELQEAKEDLERDEVIFADKMKELHVSCACRIGQWGHAYGCDGRACVAELPCLLRQPQPPKQ